MEINPLSFAGWRPLSSHLPPLFSFLFRNKPEAVEVTFAGKLCGSLVFSEKQGWLEWSAQDYAWYAQIHPAPLQEQESCAAADGVDTLQCPQSWGFVGCPTVFSVHLPSLGLSSQQ